MMGGGGGWQAERGANPSAHISSDGGVVAGSGLVSRMMMVVGDVAM